MNAKAKKLLSLVLAIVMVLGLAVRPVPVQAAGDADSYISDLIGYYKSYQENAETDILRTLDAMAKVDPVQAEAWAQIMDYWSYINTEMEVNIDSVPEGLPEDNSVAIIILGFALNNDGTMKDELIGRLQTGLAIAKAYPNAYVVVTGGGTAKNNPNVTEGGLMGEWLLQQGLAEDRLIIENKAPSTVGNAENTYKILAEEYPQVDSFVMVTSDYHVPRGCILFYAKCLLAAYEAGGEPLKLISNAGFGTGSNGYESISLQASGVAQVAGVKATSSSKLTLSKLTSLNAEYNGKLTVTAGYDSGYTRDVTDKATITGYDPSLGGKQTITVSYTENGVTKEGQFVLNAANSYISDLIGYYKSYQESAETDILRTLEEMAKVAPVQAEAWEQIMNYWSYINTEMVVNIGTVPEGLPEDNSVAIVILGFALNSDGTMKDELVGRLQTGLAIAEAYPNAYVVVTGGGTAANNPNVTEGGLMGEWLLAQGLSEDRLIIENKAPSTVGNAENTYKILAEEYPQVDSFVMVTSDYHVPRGCILFYAKCLLAAYATGGEPLKLINNAGYYTGSNGYETISLQASGVASVAGVSASSNVKLSQLTQLKVVRSGETVDVTAVYHNGYERNVTAKAEVTAVEGGLSISYTENGITMSGILADGSDETIFFSVSHLEALITEAQAISPATYTKASYADLTAAIEAAQALLDSGNYTLAQVDEAYTALETAIAGLKTLVNVAYKMNVTANCNQKNAYKVTDGTISTSNYWAGEGDNGNVPANESELVIALDGTYDLEAIRVYPYWSGQRIYQYELFASVDGENWEKIGENVSEEYITDQGVTHEVSATAAYIKLVGIRTEVVGRGDINNLHIIEIQAFGTESDNIALYKPVLSSGSDQSAASSAGAAETKANDGDPSSYWDAGKYADSPWIIVDLEGLYDLDALNVITYWKSSRYYHYDLYTSVDGNEWVKVGGKDWSTNETIYGETFDLTGKGIQAAYVKLVGVYNSSNSAFHVNELRVYGTPAHIHSYDAVVTDPTCTEGGYTTYTCACGDTYVADEVSALGHTAGEAVVENLVDATCTAAGSYDTVVSCTVCGEELTRETVAIDALGHSYEAVVTDPTCTEDGYTTYTCATCGDSYVADEVAATGHAFELIEGKLVCACGEGFSGIYNEFFYLNGVQQKAYQLVEFEGDFYFISDYHRVAKNTKVYLTEKALEGKDFGGGRILYPGYYEFGADGKLIVPEIKNGVFDGYLYINDIQQKAYQLVEFEGDFYFVSDYHKVAKNAKVYLTAAYVSGKTFSDGRDIQPGYYEFGKDGKLIVPEVKNGVVGDYLYINDVQQKAYQLVEFEGNFYFVGDYHKVAKNAKIYLTAALIGDRDLKPGYYQFGADGKMIPG